MTDDETIALRATVIAGKRYDDDFTVIRRELSIGRIMKSSGGPRAVSWSCSVHANRARALTATALTSMTARAKFKAAWTAIRAGLSEEDIASAREYAENSREALARYDRKQRR